VELLVASALTNSSYSEFSTAPKSRAHSFGAGVGASDGATARRQFFIDFPRQTPGNILHVENLCRAQTSQGSLPTGNPKGGAGTFIAWNQRETRVRSLPESKGRCGYVHCPNPKGGADTFIACRVTTRFAMCCFTMCLCGWMCFSTNGRAHDRQLWCRSTGYHDTRFTVSL
jgi:hypothetical protein